MIGIIAAIGIAILLPVVLGKIKRTRKAYIPASPSGQPQRRK